MPIINHYYLRQANVVNGGDTLFFDAKTVKTVKAADFEFEGECKAVFLFILFVLTSYNIFQ